MEAGANAGGSSGKAQSSPASAAASAAKSLLYHDYANDSKLSISLRRYKLKDQVVCPNCGQFHEPQGTHLYDYHQAVDEDLMCQICLQPLVNPLDTRCGHTFCSRCLHNYLKIQSQCPVDRQRLEDSDIQQSSILVRRLLDKLLVVCPNVDYCEEVLPRSELEAHLLHRCRGAVTRCIKSSLGCTFQGPRSALQSHLWECQYRDQDGGKNPVMDGEVSTIEIQRTQADLGISVVGGCDTPLACIVIQEIFPDGVIAKDSRLLPGDQILEVNGEDLTQATHYQAQQLLGQYYPVCRLTVYREKAEESRPIEKEEILKITLNKVKGRQLGIKLVGKRSGPGVYILSLVPESLAALDERLRPDDRVLEINGIDVSYGTQEQAAHIIQTSADKVQFVISRRSRPQTPDLIRSTSDSSTTATNYSMIRDNTPSCPKCHERLVTVTKDPLETLGISVAGGLDSPRGDTPIYVTNINPLGSLGRTKQIKKGDILLSINGSSLLGLTHNEAVSLVKMNTDNKVVCLKIINGPETSHNQGNFTPTWLFWQQMPRMCQTLKTVTLLRSPSGSLGFSVVGGVDSEKGIPPYPVYVKSVVLDTPAAKDGRLKCGDILLSVNEDSLQGVTHTKAVDLLKMADGAVALTVVSWPGTIV
ncbi:E3 ubiquitin-protein ligase LNX-like [Ylistrum balloti]|uniref:E3 ubiquitin-protein ligase LNX-like n=1 Tax=Ylistrum balloti TaxID=509963 RepID=UPI002905C60E|nr:E3 ubiquitin-protein ligase LNX-like [Ylistrum balloti]